MSTSSVAHTNETASAKGKPADPTVAPVVIDLEGLATRHNTMAFLHALAFAGRAAGDDSGQALAALADRAATQLGGG